jgi:dTDP-4-dehydrorhamnose reductase
VTTPIHHVTVVTVTNQKRPWLITGASGFLGSNAPRYLSSDIGLLSATRAGESLSGYAGSVAIDLTSVAASAAAIRAARPSVIVHSAALANHEQCENDRALARLVNAEATGQLASLAEQIGARFVYISTDAVFDGSQGNYSETDQVSPFSIYGETKLAGETAALAETNALVIRTNFFGWSPSGTRSILEFFVNNLTNEIPVNGYTDFTVTSIYAGDLLEQIELLVASGETGVFHLASRDALSKFDFGVGVAETFNLDASLISPQSAAAGTHGTSRVRNLSLSTDRIAQALDHPMPSQHEGILRARTERSA